ncbi:hypothetical protein [Pseudomonas syringae group genomosp. 7]|uniref:hypothetical protein n=1 Tax=Pseudomonas syringae group genomosp. 7 TaxID=251699 RepID=UPI00377046DB
MWGGLVVGFGGGGVVVWCLGCCCVCGGVVGLGGVFGLWVGGVWLLCFCCG